jgi:hypothetical protein
LFLKNKGWRKFRKPWWWTKFTGYPVSKQPRSGGRGGSAADLLVEDLAEADLVVEAAEASLEQLEWRLVKDSVNIVIMAAICSFFLITVSLLAKDTSFIVLYTKFLLLYVAFFNNIKKLKCNIF